MKAPKNTVKTPAMTREEWEADAQDNPGFIHFCPWERMRKPETVKRVGPPAKVRRTALLLRAAKAGRHATG